MTLTVLLVSLTPLWTQNDYHRQKNHEVKLSNTKYATNFPVTINKNKTLSLFDTGATISCMSKECFDKPDPKPALIQTPTYKVNGADGNSLGPLGTTICTLEFPEKFQQWIILCEYLL